MNLPILGLEWGIEGLRKAADRKDNVVIIDQLRFSSAVVTATALGFTIEPTSEKSRSVEGFSLSPKSFFNKIPQKVVIESPNGAYLSINAYDIKNVAFGSLLNAKAVAKWIDSLRGNSSLIAAGEIDIIHRKLFFSEYEKKEIENGNRIFALEDFMASGAIAFYSKIEKTNECIKAQEYFKKSKNVLFKKITNTASHRYNELRGKGADTEFCATLNKFNVVPKLYFIGRNPLIVGNDSIKCASL